VVNSGCKRESVLKPAMRYEWRQRSLNQAYEALIGCNIFDRECIERKIRSTPPRMVMLTLQMIKEIVGCDQKCSTPNPELAATISDEAKFMLLPKIAGFSQKCDVKKITGGGLDKAAQMKQNIIKKKEENFEKLKQKGLRSSVQNTRSTEEHKIAERQRLMNDMMGVEDAKMMYKMIHLVLSLPQPAIGTNKLRIDGKSMISSAICSADVKKQQSPGCEHFKRKQQVKAFTAFLNKTTSCSPTHFANSSTKFCKNDLFDTTEKCLFNSNQELNNSKAITAEEAQFMANLLFTGCEKSGESDPFYSAVMECSYYATLLGDEAGKGKKITKVFSHSDAIKGFEDMKSFMPPSIFNISAAEKVVIKNLFEINRCKMACPIGYTYCKDKKSCAPQQYGCSMSASKMKSTMLPSMSMNDSTSGTVNVSSIGSSIFIINRPSSLDDYGTWQYSFDGKWNNLSSIPMESGVQLDSESSIRYFQSSNHYGLRHLNFYRGVVSNDIGEVARPQGGHSLEVALMLINPEPVRSTITVETYNQSYTMNEDDPGTSGGIALSDLVTVEAPLANLNYEYYGLVSGSEKSTYETAKNEFMKYRPFVEVEQNFGSIGKLFLDEMTMDGVVRKPAPSKISLDIEFATLVFVPLLDIHGSFDLKLTFYDAENNLTAPVMNCIPVVVNSVNDRPHGKSARLPDIPYQLSSGYEGFPVYDLVSAGKGKDAESVSVGIAIIGYSGSKVGTWETNLGGNWSALNITKNGRVRTSENALLLNGTLQNRLRLKLNSNSTLWTRREARPYLLARFWDGSDNLAEGYQTMTSSHIDGSAAYSKNVYFFEQQRLACNGKPGEKKVKDVCGVCGGRGICKGCDGQPNSGAKYDKCGVCVGGTTNRTTALDCRGKCGKYVKDACGKCQRKGAKVRIFKDCAGDCFGKARLDKCGACYGGKTNVTRDSTLDICNICNGNGTTCSGCNIRDGKRIDLCGQCWLPADSNFNAGCFKIQSVAPRAASNDGGDEIVLTGSGFKSSMTCAFKNVGDNQTYSASQVTSQAASSTKRKIVTPKQMPAGRYQLVCSVDATTATKNFFVYNNGASTTTGISPNRVPISSSATLTIRGSGYKDTGDMQCVVMIRNRVAHVISAQFVNDTAVSCDLPAQKSSAEAQIALSFTSNGQWTLAQTRKLTFQSIKVYAPAPRFVSAKMNNDYRSFDLTFDSPVWTTQRSCSNLFTAATLSKFGLKPRCNIKGKTNVRVYLRTSSTLKFGDAIVIKANVFFSRFQKVVDYTPQTSQNLIAPAKQLTLTASLSGQSELGVCDSLKLSGRRSQGGGGRKLTYNWGVSFASSVDVSSLGSNATTGLTTLQNALVTKTTATTLRLKPNDLETNVAYNFTLSVSNHWGHNSSTISHEVTRSANYIPRVRIMGGRKQRVKASKLAKLQSYARIPSCMTGTNNLDFSWMIDDSSVTLDDKSSSKSTLYIKPGTLEGSTSYIATLVVSMRDDPTISASVDVQLDVVSSPLVAKIKGGRRRVIGYSQPLKLDASLSYDPDRSYAAETYYDWECVDSDDLACFVPDETNPDKYTELVLDSAAKTQVNGSRLDAGQTYSFSLYYQKGMRSSSATTKVKVLTGSPPVVNVREQRKAKENVDNFVVIRGRVKSDVGNMKVWVECVDEDGFSFVDLEDPTVLLTPREVDGVRRGYRPVGMVLNKNVLESGASYKFRFNAEHSGGLGYAEAVITTNAAPTIGALEADVTVGTALDTEFTLSAVEGWEDDVDDEPLLYNFGYYATDGTKKYLGSPSTENENTYVLPAGDANDNYTLVTFVEVSDIHGSMSESELTLTVSPPAVVDAAAVDNIMDTIDGALTADDLSSALGLISSSLTTFDSAVPEADSESMDASEIEDVEATNEKILEMKESVTNNVLTMAGDVADEETQDVIIGTLGDMTKGGDKFNTATKGKIVTTLTSMVQTQVGSGGSSRRRRSTDNSGSVDEGKVYSAEDVNGILRPYENVISTTTTDSDAMSNKKVLTDITTDLMKSMCKGIAFGQDAILATSSLADIQTVKVLFSNDSSVAVDLDCGSNCTVPTKLVAGSSLEGKYSSYACGEETCSGACVGSVNYKYDLFSTNISATLLTDIVSLSLYDPEQNNLLTPGTLTSTLQVQLPLKNEADTKYFYSCGFWDKVSSTWASDKCTAQTDTLVIGSQSYAVCECSEVGIVRVTAGSERPTPTTSAPTTEGPTTEEATTESPTTAPDTTAAATTAAATTAAATTPETPAATTKVVVTTQQPTTPEVTVPATTPKPRQKPSQIAEVSLVFEADFTSFVDQCCLGNVITLQNEMKKSIVSTLSVDDWRVTNVTCTNGSIITTFKLLPPDEAQVTNALDVLAQDIANLQKVVEDGSFTVTAGGLPVTVTKNQTLSFELVNPTDVGASTTEEDSDLTPLYVTLGALGGIALIAGLVYLALKYKNARPTWMV